MHLNQSAFNITLEHQNDSRNYDNNTELFPGALPEYFEMPTGDKIILGFLSLLGLLIVIANLTVLGLAKRMKFLRVKPNYIIISLAGSDFFSGALAIPLLVACNITLEESVCIGMDVCQRFLAISTILHLATDVLNRYFRIVKPFVYRQMITTTRLTLLIVILWVVSLTCALIQIIWMRDIALFREQFSYDLAVFIIVVFVPFLVIVHACAQMFRAIRQRMHCAGEANKIKNLKRTERRALTVYCLMTTCFVVGWFPYFILTILEDSGYHVNLPYWFNILLLFLKYGTSLADPLLYTLIKTDFLKGLKNSLMTTQTDENISLQMKTISRKSWV